MFRDSFCGAAHSHKGTLKSGVVLGKLGAPRANLIQLTGCPNIPNLMDLLALLFRCSCCNLHFHTGWRSNSRRALGDEIVQLSRSWSSLIGSPGRVMKVLDIFGHSVEVLTLNPLRTLNPAPLDLSKASLANPCPKTPFPRSLCGRLGAPKEHLFFCVSSCDPNLTGKQTRALTIAICTRFQKTLLCLRGFWKFRSQCPTSIFARNLQQHSVSGPVVIERPL